MSYRSYEPTSSIWMHRLGAGSIAIILLITLGLLFTI
jgi:hypothetical protein